MAKIDEDAIAKLKALFQDNEKALGSNFSQLIDFFNDNKVTDNGDGTFSVGNTIINVNDIVQEPEVRSIILSQLKASTDLATKSDVTAAISAATANKADDSKVVHDNHDNTITANNVKYDLSKTGITPIGLVNSGSFNDLPLGTVYAPSWLIDGPDKTHAFIVTTFYFSDWGGIKTQIAIANSTNLMYFRVYIGSNWASWVLLSDDSKVAHLSGANNFDTVPTVNNNPLLLASSLPSDLARTSQQTNFTAGLKSGGVDVATAADLKSVADNSWLPIKVSADWQSTPVLMKYDSKTGNTDLVGNFAKHWSISEGTWEGIILTLPDGFRWINGDVKIFDGSNGQPILLEPNANNPKELHAKIEWLPSNPVSGYIHVDFIKSGDYSGISKLKFTTSSIRKID